jgi:hypothetical protein
MDGPSYTLPDLRFYGTQQGQGRFESRSGTQRVELRDGIVYFYDNDPNHGAGSTSRIRTQFVDPVHYVMFEQEGSLGPNLTFSLDDVAGRGTIALDGQLDGADIFIGQSIDTVDIQGSTVKINGTDISPLVTAWTSYTPQVDQGVTTNIGKTINYCKYKKFGKLVFFSMHLVLTGAGTAAQPILVTLPPFNAAYASGEYGGGSVTDASAVTVYLGNLKITATTQFRLLYRDTANQGIGAAPSFALAAGDEIRAFGFYEST